jgi:three-Cys-motif partner protein
MSLYDELFATGMKDKWDERVYIDLYAGAGFSLIRNTNTRLKGSPVLALTVSTPFDQYVFCEEDPELQSVLKTRTARIAPKANATFILGSCDSEIEQICKAIPRGSSTHKVLSLCLVDPFDFGLKFETLKRLSSVVYVDFLVFLAVGMDANRAYEHYVEGKNPKLDEALGNTCWRDRWNAQPRGRDEFLTFLAEEFASSMSSLGYLKIKPSDMKLVRSDKNVPLYYLALFSKHPRAFKFWDEVRKYSTDQTSFNWG